MYPRVDDSLSLIIPLIQSLLQKRPLPCPWFLILHLYHIPEIYSMFLFEVLLYHGEVNGISYRRIIALIAFFFPFLVKVWDLSFESYWSGASCKVTMIGHMHTVRCLQVKRQYSTIYFFSKEKDSSSLEYF